jgi:hydroxysqualene dehydroxylase
MGEGHRCRTGVVGASGVSGLNTLRVDDASTVAVVGGGLAGISAALQLADAGCTVTVFESRPRLGGLAGSFRRGDLDVDTGQHVFLRCCTRYRSLLDRLGVADLTLLQPRLDIAVVRAADGRRGRLRRDGLPVFAGLPLHLARSLMGYSMLPMAARLSTARAALALRRIDPAADATDRRSFGAWLDQQGQPPAAVAALWDLIGVATLNARSRDASLSLAATVFQLGLLTDPSAADIGWSAVPLQRLHGDAALTRLTAAGAQVRVRERVDAVEAAGSGFRVRGSNGSVPADAVVVAADPAQAERMLPPGAIRLTDGWAQRLGSSPIVNAHFVFDRVVMSEPFVACVGSPLQWLFDRTGPSGLGTGQYLAASVSAADDVADRPVADLRAELLPEVERVLPRAREAGLVDFFVSREPNATFRQAPGSGRWRPHTATSVPGLVLAGAYTATGWPATMEGAVRSGEAAAGAVLAALSERRRVPV